MSRTWLSISALVCIAALAVSCGQQSPSPSAPSATTPESSDAAADGSTLKANAPTAQSPANNQKPESPTVVLVTTNASTKFAGNVPLTYRFEIYNAAGNRVYQSGAVPQGSGGTTSHDASAADLVTDQPYSWQVRAEYLGLFGPWSSRASFVAPEAGGYIRGNELYDPLTNGRTVGRIVGDVRLTPQGAHVAWLDSYIQYRIATLTGGEFSVVVTNLSANTKGGKTKILSMADGEGDMTTNRRRFTVEKRGDPPGMIAWRVITSDDQIETGLATRLVHNFTPDRTYFWQARWGNGQFNLSIRDGGPNGSQFYSLGEHYGGIYNPTEHLAYIGAPPGRAGIDSGSVNDMIVRQVWISSRPRPGFANR